MGKKEDRDGKEQHEQDKESVCMTNEKRDHTNECVKEKMADPEEEKNNVAKATSVGKSHVKQELSEKTRKEFEELEHNTNGERSEVVKESDIHMKEDKGLEHDVDVM